MASRFRFEKRIRNETLPPFIARYFSETVCPYQMPPARLAEFQKEALQEVVIRAYENSPFYRRKMTRAGVRPQDINDLADLAKLPFTTKDELRQDPWVLLTGDKKDILIHVSTGTTGGKEIYKLHTWREYYLNHCIIYPELFPVERGDLCLVALPYEMTVAGLNFHNKFIIGYQAAVMPAGKGGAYSTPEKTIRVMRDLKPKFVATTPSYAITLAEAAAEASFDLTSLPLKKIWLMAEGCSNALRKRVESVWGTTVNLSYGSLECDTLATECDAHNGYHVNHGHLLVEIVDPGTGKVLGPGEIGEIVATPLLRFDTPLIRYRTQDLGCLDPKPCSCGIASPLLHLRGRAVNHINLKGKSFSPVFLEEFLMRLPEVGNWYQFVVQPGNNDQLKIRTELAAGVEPAPELAEKLAGKMELATGIPCVFEFVAKLPRPREKVVRVVYEQEG
ncbi:MAG: AMP-binding protein [Peptococcaceae bacterium]|nr:AMP-binding protein [Peptococcaceae bacterium]